MTRPYPFEDPLGEEIELSAVYFESSKVSVRNIVTGEFMRNNMRLREDVYDFMTGNMVYELSTLVRTHNLPPETIQETGILACDTPSSWWQRWKHDVATNRRGLRWIARRWPVQMTRTVHKLTLTLDLRRFRYYPDAPDTSRLAGFETHFLGHTRHITAGWDSEPGSPQ